MTRKTAAWMPLYIEAYDRATLHLSEAEDGVYGRLLRHYWVKGPPPDDDAKLARLARVELKHWLRYRPALQEFFEVRDGRWFQGRADEELAKARDVSAKRMEAGAKGGRPRTQKVGPEKPIGFADGPQTGTHARVASHLTLPSEDTSSGDKSPADGGSPKRARPKRTIPDGWAPSEIDQAYAAKHGFSSPETERMAERFANHARAQDRRCADWQHAWRNWVLEERKRSPPKPKRVIW